MQGLTRMKKTLNAQQAASGPSVESWTLAMAPKAFGVQGEGGLDCLLANPYGVGRCRTRS